MIKYISSPIEAHKDTFAILPVGTEGTVVGTVDDSTGGCYVEFPYIRQHHPRADAVMWMEFDQIKRKES